MFIVPRKYFTNANDFMLIYLFCVFFRFLHLENFYIHHQTFEWKTFKVHYLTFIKETIINQITLKIENNKQKEN